MYVLMLKHTMSSMSNVAHTFTISLLLHVTLTKSAGIRLETTVPIQSAEVGGVFSVHCQVWNLGDDVDVSIIKRTPSVKRLSIGEGVYQGVEERVFLAVRTLIDGSKIFFLTFMDARKEDQGEYVCKTQAIDDSDTTRILPSDSVTIDILYFPDEKEPVCTPKTGQVAVAAGTEVTLNCSSELGNPVINVEWTRSGTDTVIPTDKYTESDIAFSELRIRPKLADDKAIYICHISSDAFPGVTKTCHVQLVVIGGSNKEPSDEERNDAVTTQRPSGELASSDLDISESIVDKCKNVCDNNNIFYWVLATVIAGLIALICLIVSIILLIRYHFTSQTNSEEHYMPASRHPREDIYTELEGRLGDNVVFMKLQKPIAPEHNVHRIPIQR
ncbi:uncharacterized protein [Amphiura filiformis]|uniref:uncharacterized protein n=1 Tax=Amphiura filiformis TaxID=82378 RepID=UPI003B226EDD